MSSLPLSLADDSDFDKKLGRRQYFIIYRGTHAPPCRCRTGYLSLDELSQFRQDSGIDNMSDYALINVQMICDFVKHERELKEFEKTREEYEKIQKERHEKNCIAISQWQSSGTVPPNPKVYEIPIHLMHILDMQKFQQIAARINPQNKRSVTITLPGNSNPTRPVTSTIESESSGGDTQGGTTKKSPKKAKNKYSPPKEQGDTGSKYEKEVKEYILRLKKMINEDNCSPERAHALSDYEIAIRLKMEGVFKAHFWSIVERVRHTDAYRKREDTLKEALALAGETGTFKNRQTGNSPYQENVGKRRRGWHNDLERKKKISNAVIKSLDRFAESRVPDNTVKYKSDREMLAYGVASNLHDQDSDFSGWDIFIILYHVRKSQAWNQRIKYLEQKMSGQVK